MNSENWEKVTYFEGRIKTKVYTAGARNKEWFEDYDKLRKDLILAMDFAVDFATCNSLPLPENLPSKPITFRWEEGDRWRDSMLIATEPMNPISVQKKMETMFRGILPKVTYFFCSLIPMSLLNLTCIMKTGLKKKE